MKVISLGAGVQSTALLLMSIRGEIERADCAIFADTGWEPESVYAHLNRLMAYGRENNFTIHVVKRRDSHGIDRDVLHNIEQYQQGGEKWRTGQPPFYVKNLDGDGTDDGGTLWRQCTKKYKIEPIQSKIRELLGYKGHQRVKKNAEQWMGITVDEMQRMKGSGVKWLENKYPFIDLRMDRNNCQKWLDRNWPHPVAKSACIGCPYHSNAMWRDMKANQPAEWNSAVVFDQKLRKKPYPGVTGSPFLHRSCKPLDEVDLTTAEDHGQMSFLDECEGMCGV